MYVWPGMPNAPPGRWKAQLGETCSIPAKMLDLCWWGAKRHDAMCDGDTSTEAEDAHCRHQGPQKLVLEIPVWVKVSGCLSRGQDAKTQQDLHSAWAAQWISYVKHEWIQ